MQMTSVAAYESALKSGLIAGQLVRVGHLIATYGPGTSAEVLKGTGLDANRNLARARFTELANRGLITEVERRRCKITGRKAIVWRFVGASGKPRVRTSPQRTLDALRKHIADCPLGYHGGHTIIHRGTSEEDVIEWIRKLRELGA